VTSIYHVSDLHFGHPAIPDQIDAIEEEIREGAYDVVAISGDFSQRARAGELLRGRSFMRDAAKYSKVIAVPGNHDVRWWQAPMGLGDLKSITTAIRYSTGRQRQTSRKFSAFRTTLLVWYPVSEDVT
jgi:3',5'-cyclic AMP phosphodiesterase CpdA